MCEDGIDYYCFAVEFVVSWQVVVLRARLSLIRASTADNQSNTSEAAVFLYVSTARVLEPSSRHGYEVSPRIELGLPGRKGLSTAEWTPTVC